MTVSKRRIFKDVLQPSEDDGEMCVCGWWAAQALNHQPKPCGAASSLALAGAAEGDHWMDSCRRSWQVFMEPDGF